MCFFSSPFQSFTVRFPCLVLPFFLSFVDCDAFVFPDVIRVHNIICHGRQPRQPTARRPRCSASSASYSSSSHIGWHSPIQDSDARKLVEHHEAPPWSNWLRWYGSAHVKTRMRVSKFRVDPFLIVKNNYPTEKKNRAGPPMSSGGEMSIPIPRS